MAATTAAEVILIEKFRKELTGLLDEPRLSRDDFLLRWIRARNHDLIKAKEMLVNHLKWHSEKNISHILSTPKPPIFDLHFKYHYGVDREGRPLFIALPGQWNIKELLKLTTPELIVNEFIRVMETLKYRVEEARSNAMTSNSSKSGAIIQMQLIGDFHGFGFQQANSWPVIQRLLEMASVVEAHYPEIVRKIYFINCPKLFMFIVPMFKKIFSEGTVEKLEFYGGNVNEWWPVLSGIAEEKYLGVLHAK